MRRETHGELSERIFALIDGKTTDLAPEVYLNPVEGYTSPEKLEQEMRTLFRQYPLLMGMSCRIPEPGDYFTDDNTGVPMVVIRGDDGKVNAFVNVCTHRGARVLEGEGKAGRLISCPYHAWAFDRAGCLVKVPDAESFAGVDLETCGLTVLPCEERDGLIWVLPTPGGVIELDKDLNGLADELSSYGYDTYHHYETRTIRQKINWKGIMDTFLEPYHFAALHRDTVAPIFFANMCLFDGFGPHLREVFPRKTIEKMRDQPKSEWDAVTYSAIVYVLFPNTAFVMQADHVEIWRIFPVPGKPDESVTHLEFYIPEPVTSESARRHWDNNMDLVIRTVQEEDFPTGEGIQSGYHSGARSHVIYGRNEPALMHFERSVSEALDTAG
ncbi:MAG: Rieske 2Fe-2S domain-containing protein [Rhodospirillaceae bacterium]|nr:Rieske 2Fe-2S domain-containing protein [Rhodospirillaceae bacterium]MBT6136563.1 Rieske 2Fe-2S domain-containing protein [Rhodospirillaceae bacterium]